MLRGPSKRQREADKRAQQLQEAAEKRARQAPMEGLSPPRGRGGSPCYMNKPGHHWELVRLSGQRQYLDSETIHVDPHGPGGPLEFRCRLRPEIQNTSGPQKSGPASSATDNELPNLNLIDPAFGHGHFVGGTAGPQTSGPASSATNDELPNLNLIDPALGNGHVVGRTADIPVKLDLTNSPSPTPGANVPVTNERKPNQVTLTYHVYIPNGLSDADRRNGLPQTYSDHNNEKPFAAMVQIHGKTLIEVKESLFNMCDKNKKGCGKLLRIATQEGHVVFKGYITHGGIFGKSLMPVIETESSFTAFKDMMISKEGKEVGFSLSMENPKRTARTLLKEDNFDTAMARRNPQAVEPDRHAELEMASIDVNPSVQAIKVELMTKYGHCSIAGRECMGCYNPMDSHEAMQLSHIAFDIWANALHSHALRVSWMKPPTGPDFKWESRYKNPPARAHTALNPESTSSTVLPVGNSLRSDSPAPRPLPEFEEYLQHCSISKDDIKTRTLLRDLNIVTFEMFLSPQLSVEEMFKRGFDFGPRLGLHDQAVVYQDFLKK